MSQSKKSMIKNLLNLPFKIGSKDSRQSVLSYDEAVRRVPEQDLQRVKKSFKKDAVSDYLPKTVFITQVMGESVPSRVAEAMYVAFGGGSRGISYKDLVSGLVLLSCGTQMEKLDFLFHLCSGGSSSMPVSDLIATIKISEDGHVPDHVVHAFSAATSVTADMFREWISRYWSSMALTRWLLESDFKPELIAEPGRDEIPTFYQTLAGVTHLDEKEIFTLEKFYLSTKSSRNLSFGRFDVSLFASLVSPPLPSCIVVNLFQAFDENGDGHLDLKEIVCGVSACCRGPLTERQKFLYKVFDIRRQKRLGVDEISNMLSVLLSVDDGRANGEMVERLAEDLADQFGEETVTNGRVLALEGFLIWAQKSGFTSKFMKLLFQICHVVLGLRPQNKEDELSCIIEWLQRDSHRPKNVGDVYYIVNMDWWKSWRRYAEDGFSETSFISDMDTLSNGRKRSNALNNLADLLPRISSRPASRASTPTLSRSSSTMSVQASRHPGPINNQPLVLPEKEKCKSITDEGAVLKKRSDGTQLRENEDFVLVSESVWKVLSLWYSVNGPELPRLCVRMGQEDAVDVDVFPVCLRLLRHRITDMNRPYNPYPYGGMVGGSHAFSYVPNGSRGSPLVERIIFASACFSSTARFSDMHDTFCRKLRLPFDDVRLWVYVDENNLTLVEDESVTVGQLNLKDLDQILLEMRNKDLTWPEELTSLSHCSPSNRRTIARSGSISREDGGYEKGCCGLNNLGNTCFMNSALQCISYSRPLTYYFRTGNFLGELNRKNPIGFGGMIAERYAELLTQLWSGRMRTLAPVKLKSAISQNTRAFNGFQQHDSQELLAFILDGLHEDLNRVHEKPYVELNDSEGRPDEVVAEEAWENHLRRNQSIVVDLFHGLLKSRVKCLTCSKASVRFDPFSILSLPLPLDNLIFVEFPLVRCNGLCPVRHGLRIDPECNMEGLRDAYAAVSRLDCEEIVIAEVGQGLVRRFYSGDVKLQSAVPASDSRLLMYQIPVLSSSSSIVSKADEDCVSHGSYSGQMDARWIVAVHRRMVHNETYYLAWAKAIPKTFGLPVLVACDETTTTRDLYERVWQQIKRFIGPETPISEESNHAQECNTQTGGYSFSLKLVREDGCWCSACPWYRFCRGCLLLPSDHLFAFASGTVVIDWEPTFYHLRYQESLEFIMEEDESVRRARTEHCEPITLDSCLKAFTHEEKLGPDALYQCSKCGKGQLASKRMQLWRLPPVLAVHFKRFQKVRDHWVKSHKIVTFPKSGLDLSQYLAVPDAPMTPVSFLAADIEGKPVATSESVNPASVPDKKERPANGSRIHQGDGDCSRSDDFETGNSVSPVRNYLERSSSHEFETEDGNAEPKVNGLDRPTEDEKRDTNGEKPGAVKKDVHHHRLSAGIDAGDLKYDLYAICCHSGLLATGHYVAYCKNPNGKWYLFNDSSCKELTEEQMDTSTSYMLFYERRGLDYSAYLPPLPPPPVPTDQTELSRNTSSSSTLHDGSHPDSDLPVRESRPNADTALPDDPKSQCTLQ